MTQIVIMALATATVSVTIAQSSAFKWLRDWTNDVPVLGTLLSCSYCLGHWVAAALVFGNDWEWWITAMAHETIIPFTIAWLAVTGIAALISGAIGRLHGER